VIVLPMAFLSGSFGPTADYPAFLQAVGDVLPLKYFLDIVNGIYLEGESLFADPTALAIVVAWGLAGLAVAWRRFGWVPREMPS
jgi:ABC-2 type transport system permease protein